MYVYITSPQGNGFDLYTVGFYKPDGKWVPESDHEKEEKAAARVHHLNGGREAVVKVFCPECREAGMRSQVHSGGGMETLMGWHRHWDSDGNPHSHDPNTHTRSFSCDNGHRWQTKSKDPCPNVDCDFGKG